MVSKSFVTSMLYPYLAMCPSKHVNAYQLCQCNTQTTSHATNLSTSHDNWWHHDNLQVIKAAQNVELEAECRLSNASVLPCMACIAFTGSCRYMAIMANVEGFLRSVPWRSPIVPVDLIYSCASCYLLRLTAAKHITTSPTHYARFGRSALITQLLKFALLQVTVRRVMKQILSINMPLF